MLQTNHQQNKWRSTARVCSKTTQPWNARKRKKSILRQCLPKNCHQNYRKKQTSFLKAPTQSSTPTTWRTKVARKWWSITRRKTLTTAVITPTRSSARLMIHDLSLKKCATCAAVLETKKTSSLARSAQNHSTLIVYSCHPTIFKACSRATGNAWTANHAKYVAWLPMKTCLCFVALAIGPTIPSA